MNIGGVEVGSGQPCRFVAEISNAHNGSIDRAYRLIQAAKDCGADFLKLQCYTPDELIALRGDGKPPAPWDHMTMRELYEKARTPLDWFPDLFQYARNAGIVPFSSVFGAESLACLETVDCPAYKIAALDSENEALVRSVALTGKSFIVSQHGMRYVAGQPAHLYCPPGYPTRMEDVRLPMFGPWNGEVHVQYLGLSSHCLAPELPIAAVARGCNLIEMHFQLEYEPSELEHNVSLTPPQFKRMIESVRRTEAMLAH